MKKILAVMAAVAMVQSAAANEGSPVTGEKQDSGLGELSALDMQVFMVPAPVQTASLER